MQWVAMATTLTYVSLNEVPETLRDNAKEVDGKFTVTVVPKAQLESFRENNIKLSKERDGLVGKLTEYEQVTGVTLDQVEQGKLTDFSKVLTALRETKKRVDDGVLVENTSVEEAAAARLTDVTNGFKVQLSEAAKERDAWKERASKSEEMRNQLQIENAIRLAASDPDVAMLDKAVSYILPAAFKIFKIDATTSKIVPKDEAGTTIYGYDGVAPMTIKEWLLKQREVDSFLFRGTSGGGAGGSSELSGRLSQAELDKMSPAQRINYARKNNIGK